MGWDVLEIKAPPALKKLQTDRFPIRVRGRGELALRYGLHTYVCMYARNFVSPLAQTVCSTTQELECASAKQASKQASSPTMNASRRLLQACRITLFSRDNCGLCTQAKGVLSDVWDKRPFAYEEVNLALPESNAWRELYDFDIPVVRKEIPLVTTFILPRKLVDCILMESSNQTVIKIVVNIG